MKSILRAMAFGITGVIALSAIAYVADYCSVRYQVPSRPQFGQVTVNVFYAIRLKDGKVEYDAGQSETDPCVHSLFPQLGCNPCWYVEKHTERWVDI